MSKLGNIVRQVKPVLERRSIDYVDRVQNLYEAELSEGKEDQDAIIQAEKIDQKIATISAETSHKGSNKNRITLTQVVDNKDRIKFASLARDVIEDDPELELIPIRTARSDKDYHFRHPDIPQSVYVQLKPSGAKGQVREDPNELLTVLSKKDENLLSLKHKMSKFEYHLHKCDSKSDEDKLHIVSMDVITIDAFNLDLKLDIQGHIEEQNMEKQNPPTKECTSGSKKSKKIFLRFS